MLAKYADSAVTSTNTNAEADVTPIVASEPASDVTGSAVGMCNLPFHLLSLHQLRYLVHLDSVPLA